MHSSLSSQCQHVGLDGLGQVSEGLSTGWTLAFSSNSTASFVDIQCDF